MGCCTNQIQVITGSLSVNIQPLTMITGKKSALVSSFADQKYVQKCLFMKQRCVYISLSTGLAGDQ